jgi:hypothetical protein
MRKSPGQITLEPVIAIAVFAIVIVPFISSVSNLLSFQVKNRRMAQASQYAREGLEITYNLAATVDDWEEFVDKTGKEYYPSAAGTLVLHEFDSNNAVLDELFTRKIILSKAERDGENNVVESGTPDPNTVKAVCQVAWEERGQPMSVEQVTYLSKLSTNVD